MILYITYFTHYGIELCLKEYASPSFHFCKFQQKCVFLFTKNETQWSSQTVISAMSQFESYYETLSHHCNCFTNETAGHNRKEYILKLQLKKCLSNRNVAVGVNSHWMAR